MDNSIYITLSKQAAQFRQMEHHANNIANADTVGFQKETMLFTKYLVDDGNRYKMAFAQDIATHRDTRSGGLKMTGERFDVAISGDGYFVTETPLGNRYTRAGNFQMDGNGVLTTPDGFPVLAVGGQRIEFQPEDREVVISEEGFVIVDGEERGQLDVVQFANQQLMEHAGDNAFRTDAPAQPAENFRVLQGVLEQSNVQPVRELTAMMKTSRSVGNTSRLINTMYELQRQTTRTYAQNQ